MSEIVRQSTQVHRFLREKGETLVELMGESPLAEAEWEVASHGAWLHVEGEHEGIFERLMVVLVRPDNRSSQWFRDWAEQRLTRLGAYMEACNTGRMVRTLIRDASATGVLVRRVGRDPNEPDTELPSNERIPGLLADFVRDIERYLLHLSDHELRYVRAIRMHRIPRKTKAPLFLLGLDVLPTATGLTLETSGIAPLSLVRGVIGELAEQMAERRDGLMATRSVTRPMHFAKTANAMKRAERLVDGLDSLCADIDELAPELVEVRGALVALGREL